jgi:hypothetical protein
MKITIYDCESGETITRDMTDDESAAFLERQQNSTQQYAAIEARKKALLDKLGITEDEAKLLLS